MYKEVITKYLDSIGRTYSIRGDEIQTSCLNPKHLDSNPSFSINTVTGLMGCFSCGYKNHLSNLVEKTESFEELERSSRYLQALKSLEESEEWVEESIETFIPPDSGLKVLPFRGLSAKTIESKGIYYCNVGRYSGRIIFPMDSGFDARVYPLDPTEPKVPSAKYLRPTTFKTANEMYICIPDEPKGPEGSVIICEGVMDALSFMELGYSAACNFGLQPCSPHKAGQLLSLGFTKVLNGFDSDTAGLTGWQNTKESWREYFEVLRPTGILQKVHRFNGDINDYLQAGIEDI